ncbi:MAG: helix-turn-helix transcriptional regulator [Nocardioidaceae bacterium]
MTTLPQWTMADRLRKARKVSGMTQGQFADAIGTTVARVLGVGGWPQPAA